MDSNRRPREALVGEAIARETVKRMFRRQQARPVAEEAFVGLVRCVIEAAYRASVTSGMNEEDATWVRNSILHAAEEAYVVYADEAEPPVPEDEARRRFRGYLRA